MEEIVEKFIDYSKYYDLSNLNIRSKFTHSFRVMRYSADIAKSLNLSKSDIELASKIGLLHDISRFYQYEKYQTWNDLKSFDHGLYSKKILETFLENEDDKDIILTAVFNHNKFKTEINLDYKSNLFCKIIKDADKLDIMKTQCNTLKEKITHIDLKYLECFFKQTLLLDSTCEEEYIFILRTLAFIFDLNFEYSFLFVKENNIIEDKINLLKENSDEEEKIEKIRIKLLEYTDEKLRRKIC